MSGTKGKKKEKKRKKRQVPTLRKLTSGEQTAEHTVQCDKCFDRGRTEENIEESLKPACSVRGSVAEVTRSELSPEGPLGVIQLVELREVHIPSKETQK